MKITRECRCGAKASWEDDTLQSQIRRLASEWDAEHVKCIGTIRVPTYEPAPGPEPFMPAPGWPPNQITCGVPAGTHFKQQ